MHLTKSFLFKVITSSRSFPEVFSRVLIAPEQLVLTGRHALKDGNDYSASPLKLLFGRRYVGITKPNNNPMLLVLFKYDLLNHRCSKRFIYLFFAGLKTNTEVNSVWMAAVKNVL